MRAAYMGNQPNTALESLLQDAEMNQDGRGISHIMDLIAARDRITVDQAFINCGYPAAK